MQLPEPLPEVYTAGQPQTSLEKAARDAVDAAANSDQLAVIAAILQAQQLMQAQQQPCQHQAPQQEFNAKKWLIIGGVGCVCALAFALASIAIAIGGVSLTACLIVLRSMWRDYQKGK